VSGLAQGRRVRGSALAAVSVGLATALLAACSAGQVSQTADQVAAVSGRDISTADGRIALRDVTLAYNPQGYATGATAPLLVRIFNNGGKAITLTGVTVGDNAGRVVLVGGAPDATRITPVPAQPSGTPSAATSPARPNASGQATSPSPTGTAAPAPGAGTGASASPGSGTAASPGASGTASPTATATPTATPTGSPTGSPAPAPTASSPAAAGAESFRITIPAESYVVLTPAIGRYLAVTALAKKVGVGEGVRLTWRFDDGTTIETRIEVGVPLSPAPRTSASFAGEHGGGLPGH
jgi:copper(I)-binding protein